MRCCERKPAVPPSEQAHTGRVAVKKVISDGALTGLSSAVITEKKLRVTFALDCCDREALRTGRSQRVASSSETVQDVMLGAVERRWQRASGVSSGVADG